MGLHMPGQGDDVQGSRGLSLGSQASVPEPEYAILRRVGYLPVEECLELSGDSGVGTLTWWRGRGVRRRPGAVRVDEVGEVAGFLTGTCASMAKLLCHVSRREWVAENGRKKIRYGSRLNLESW